MASNNFPGVCRELLEALSRRDYAEPTAVQRSILSSEASGRNLRISSQTGSGKTVAIGLAIAPDLMQHVAGTKGKVSGPYALFITPTRELAVQVRDELTWLFENIKGVMVQSVTGGSDVRRDQRMLSRKPMVLVGTPGRLLDHLGSGKLVLKDIGHVVLDEADQMLDMGFKDELDSIVEALPETRCSHLVSATFPREVKRLADRFQDDPLHVQGTQLGAANQDIEHIAYVMRPKERYAALVNILLLEQGERCLVFVERRVDAAEVAEYLERDHMSALPLSGDLAQAQRTRTLNAFRNGTVKTLVATDVAARGIDVADISTVIHLSMPRDAAIYTHRSGRTGRAGRRGRSVLLIPPFAERRVRHLMERARISVSWEALPTAAQIVKALQKRSRRVLHEKLETQRPDKELLTYAKTLLERYDSPSLVAHLLAIAQPELPTAPLDVASVAPHQASDAPRPRTTPKKIAANKPWRSKGYGRRGSSKPGGGKPPRRKK